MPYRRSRSYRSAPRLYRQPGRSARPRFVLTAVLLAVALTAALTITLSSQGGTALSSVDRAVNSNCDIIIPAHPLSAVGLATPYRLTGPHGDDPVASGCNEANADNLGAFVQATILDPATGALSVYEPLVITQGSKPAVAPVKPQLPSGAVVTIDIGFNGSNLTQVGATPHALAQGDCVNGLPGSVFGQVSFCNGGSFFRAAFKAESRGKLKIPPAGVSPVTKQACPTTRSFELVDQDPSDNVTTLYLLTRAGRTAQLSPRNVAALPGATQISNGSDNALLDDFVDPALRCRPFEVPDLSRDGARGTSQALNELSAARSQAPPVALVPQNDPMTLVHGAFNLVKTNLYRSSVGQPTIASWNSAYDSPRAYCSNMMKIQTPFLGDNQSVLGRAPSPEPTEASNLLTFMASRLIASFGNLRCGRYGPGEPLGVSRDKAGVAIAVRFGPRLVPASGTYVGASADYDHALPKMNGSKSQINVLEANIGRTLDIDNNYYCFGPTCGGDQGDLVSTGTYKNPADVSDNAAGRISLDSWSCSAAKDSSGTSEDPAGIVKEYKAWQSNPSSPGPTISYLIAQAQDVATYKLPLLIRWAWEMDAGANKSCVNSQSSLAVNQSTFRDAWIDVWTIFQKYGASNAAWVWCPSSTGFGGKAPAPGYFPGAPYVTYVCADGYDRGTGEGFSSLFGKAYAFATSPAVKLPFMVGETGSETGAGQADWITSDLFGQIENATTGQVYYKDVKAVLYWDSWNSQTCNDYTITSATSISALRDVVASTYFNPAGRTVTTPVSQPMKDDYKCH
jgi:hypothetical protein